MQNRANRIQHLADLREYVHQVLCTCDQLEIGAFQMTERILVQSGRACGILFCLHGPRSVKLTAIWDARRNTVLFYGSGGERFYKTQLLDTIDVELMAA